MDPIRTGFAREHIASWPSGKLNPHPLTRSNSSYPLVQLFESNIPKSFESFNPYVQTSGSITLSKKFLALYATKYVTMMIRRTWDITKDCRLSLTQKMKIGRFVSFAFDPCEVG